MAAAPPKLKGLADAGAAGTPNADAGARPPRSKRKAGPAAGTAGPGVIEDAALLKPPVSIGRSTKGLEAEAEAAAADADTLEAAADSWKLAGRDDSRSGTSKDVEGETSALNANFSVPATVTAKGEPWMCLP